MPRRPVPASIPAGRDLVRLARGCWAGADAATDLATTCSLLLASGADDSIVVLTTAGRLHGAWLPSSLDDIHVATAAPGRLGQHMTRTRRPEIVAHRRQLPPEDRMLLDGVTITTPARTWRDLAAVLPKPDLVAAGDSILRRGTTRDELADVLDRTSGLRGARRARIALPLLDHRSRSRPESHLRVAVSGPEMPAFEVNEPVYRNEGGWLAEPDLALPAAKLALEYQGEEHARLDRMRKDITRAADLRSQGWLCIMFGPSEVFRRPFQIRPEVRLAIAERAPELLRPRPRTRVVS